MIRFLKMETILGYLVIAWLFNWWPFNKDEEDL